MSGKEVSREPPAIFARVLAPLLTPVEDVLAGGREAFPGNRESGVILLRERINHVADDGTRYRVEQRIYEATDTAGAREIEKTVFRFDGDRERVFLIDAYTWQPDGSVLPVAANAAFIQTPQHEASNSLYTSQAELSLLFRDVRVGSVVVATVLREEFAPMAPHPADSKKALSPGCASLMSFLIRTDSSLEPSGFAPMF